MCPQCFLLLFFKDNHWIFTVYPTPLSATDGREGGRERERERHTHKGERIVDSTVCWMSVKACLDYCIYIHIFRRLFGETFCCAMFCAFLITQLPLLSYGFALVLCLFAVPAVPSLYSACTPLRWEGGIIGGWSGQFGLGETLLFVSCAKYTYNIQCKEDVVSFWLRLGLNCVKAQCKLRCLTHALFWWI